jgi:hypothetical protein
MMPVVKRLIGVSLLFSAYFVWLVLIVTVRRSHLNIRNPFLPEHFRASLYIRCLLLLHL